MDAVDSVVFERVVCPHRFFFYHLFFQCEMEYESMRACSKVF